MCVGIFTQDVLIQITVYLIIDKELYFRGSLTFTALSGGFMFEARSVVKWQPNKDSKWYS